MIDIMPTLLAFADICKLETMKGRPLQELAQDKAAYGLEEVFNR